MKVNRALQEQVRKLRATQKPKKLNEFKFKSNDYESPKTLNSNRAAKNQKLTELFKSKTRSKKYLNQDMDFSDYAQLPKVLSQKSVYESLSDLRTLAQDSSRAYQPRDSYQPCIESFCDGIELKLGLIPKETA